MYVYILVNGEPPSALLRSHQVGVPVSTVRTRISIR